MEYFIKAVASPVARENAAKTDIRDWNLGSVSQSVDLGVVPGVPLKLLETLNSIKTPFNERWVNHIGVHTGAQLRRLYSTEVTATADLLIAKGAKEFLTQVADILSSLSIRPALELSKQIRSEISSYHDLAIAQIRVATNNKRATITKLSGSPAGSNVYNANELSKLGRWGLTSSDLNVLQAAQILPCVFNHDGITVELSSAALAECYKIFNENLAFSALANADEVCLGNKSWTRGVDRPTGHLGIYGAELYGNLIIPANPTPYYAKTELVYISNCGAPISSDSLFGLNLFTDVENPFYAVELVNIPEADSLKSLSDFTMGHMTFTVAEQDTKKLERTDSMIGGLY